MSAQQRIGILTGGGDVPGLNSVIKSVVYRSTELGYDVIGLRRGWEALTHMRPSAEFDPEYVRPLDRINTRTIDRTGGTTLHSSRTNPKKMRVGKLPEVVPADRLPSLQTGEGVYDFTPVVLENLDRLGIHTLIAIGGDDTLSYAKVLADAGFPGGSGIPVITQEVQDDTLSSQHFQAAQRDFAEIGIRTEAYKVTWQEMNTRISKAQAQMWGISWGADYPEAQNFLQLFYGPNKSPGPNGSNYENPAFDALYQKAQNLPEGPERTALYRQMQRIVVDDCVWIFKYRRLQFNLIHPWFRGYRYNDINAKYYKYCRADSAARREATRELNVAKPWWAIGFVALFGVLVAVTVASSRRTRKGW